MALLLFGLQMVFGLLAAAKYLGPDPLLDILPFDVVEGDPHQSAARVGAHGFMGATYCLVPEESRAELYSVRLAYMQLVLWTAMGVTASSATCSAGRQATSCWSSRCRSRSSSSS